MTDREAMIAGIAADPDNDLRRLVFADWLDEHGEPERAEFVRLQVEVRHIPQQEVLNNPSAKRAAELFRLHGQRWFHTFLTALDPRLVSAEPNALKAPSSHTCCEIDLFFPKGNWLSGVANAELFLWGVSISGGFADRVTLFLDWTRVDTKLAQAFQLEPVKELRVLSYAPEHFWHAFTTPALRSVQVLSLGGFFRDWAGYDPVFHDPNLNELQVLKLTGASSFSRFSGSYCLRSVSWRSIRALAKSPLGARLAHLEIDTDNTGLRELCRWPFPQLEHLVVNGAFTGRGLRLLPEADFAVRLKLLSLPYNQETPVSLRKRFGDRLA